MYHILFTFDGTTFYYSHRRDNLKQAIDYTDHYNRDADLPHKIRYIIVNNNEYETYWKKVVTRS